MGHSQTTILIESEPKKVQLNHVGELPKNSNVRLELEQKKKSIPRKSKSDFAPSIDFTFSLKRKILVRTSREEQWTPVTMIVDTGSTVSKLPRYGIPRDWNSSLWTFDNTTSTNSFDCYVRRVYFAFDETGLEFETMMGFLPEFDFEKAVESKAKKGDQGVYGLMSLRDIAKFFDVSITQTNNKTGKGVAMTLNYVSGGKPFE